jgi:hypothetical protein
MALMDYAIRQAERLASTGDIHAQAELLNRKLRNGQIDLAKVELAAYLGDDASQLLVGAGEGCADKDPGVCLSLAIEKAELPTKTLLRFALQCVERVVPPWFCSVEVTGEMIDLVHDYLSQCDLEKTILRERYPTTIDEFLEITRPSSWIRTKISRNVTEVFSLVYGYGNYAEIARTAHLAYQLTPDQPADCAPLTIAEAIASMGAILAANPSDSEGPSDYARSVVYLIGQSMSQEEAHDESIWQIELFINYLLS